jgi:hypothetical protein
MVLLVCCFLVCLLLLCFLVVCLCVLWCLFRRAGSSVVELSIAARRVTGSNPVSRLILLPTPLIHLTITTSCHPPFILYAASFYSRYTTLYSSIHIHIHKYNLLDRRQYMNILHSIRYIWNQRICNVQCKMVGCTLAWLMTRESWAMIAYQRAETTWKDHVVSQNSSVYLAMRLWSWFA